ncbi:MAG TPA: LacI family DNA-binding transcriptional regulator [Dermatophilaceae bacterium]|nr:LacI family DNA-binding transcriptional regulator [Dermatophilaceae bacterium]
MAGATGKASKGKAGGKGLRPVAGPPDEAGSDDPVTLAMVARQAGVSVATASRVLQGGLPASPGARSAVLHAVQDLGYRPPGRRRAARAATGTFGLVVPDLSRPNAELFLGAAVAAARQERAVIPLVSGGEGDLAAQVHELAGRVDGLMVVGGSVPDAVVLRLAARMPVVLVARDGLPRCRSITVQTEEVAEQLTRHLFDHGHRRLVFVGDPERNPEVSIRYQGFRSAHLAAGVPIRRPALRVPLVEGAGRRVAEELQRRRFKVDGLVCATDELALGVLAGLGDSELLVPDDVAIIGWGDAEAARFVRPTLTTVALPLREMGERAAEMLSAVRTQPNGRDTGIGSGPVDRLELPSKLVRRASCGCPGPRLWRPARPPRADRRRSRKAAGPGVA